jgi:uncharacterized protein YutE (UPF0331/DUF86 family)
MEESMVDRVLIERILADLRANVQDLREERNLDWETFRTDKKLRRYIERTLHISIEAIFDAAQHIISDQGFREPISYRDTFLVLAENGVIGRELLPRLENMASFRNLLVHYYERIDNEIVFDILKKNLDDFDLFTMQLIAYLKSVPVAPGDDHPA